MEDFKQLLKCYDERLANTLDQQYSQQERKFAKERHGSRKFPKDVPPVDPEPRQRQVPRKSTVVMFLKEILIV